MQTFFADDAVSTTRMNVRIASNVSTATTCYSAEWIHLPFLLRIVTIPQSVASTGANGHILGVRLDPIGGMVAQQIGKRMNKVKKGLQMTNVIKKHCISFELAQKMVNAAVAKARELGVSENVAILDDGGNLKAFTRMDGAPIPTIEMAQNKAYTALLGVSTQDFFKFIQSDPSLLAGIPTLSRMAAWGGGFPIRVNGELVGAIGVSGAPTVQNDEECAKAALALVSDGVAEG